MDLPSCLTLAFSISPCFKDDTCLGIAGHESGIGKSVNSLLLCINCILKVLGSLNSFIISDVEGDVSFDFVNF